MKKIILLILCVVIFVPAVYILSSGFSKCGTVFIQNYTVSEDAQSMTITTAFASSIGYARKVSSKQEDGNLYLVFISAFGGINGSIGAKNQYDLLLNDELDAIYIYNSDGSYRKSLEKDDSGEWVRVK